MLLPRLACHWNLPEGGPLRKYTDSTGHNRVSKVASPHLTHPVSWLARSRRPDSDLAGGPHSSCPSFPLFYRSPYLWNTNHSLLDICFLSLFFLLEYRSWVKSWETTEGAQSGFLPRVDEAVLRRPSRQGKGVEVLMERAPYLYPWGEKRAETEWSLWTQVSKARDSPWSFPNLARPWHTGLMAACDLRVRRRNGAAHGGLVSSNQYGPVTGSWRREWRLSREQCWHLT